MPVAVSMIMRSALSSANDSERNSSSRRKSSSSASSGAPEAAGTSVTPSGPCTTTSSTDFSPASTWLRSQRG